jgi:aminoglycoside 3-N-acetyltransferase I
MACLKNYCRENGFEEAYVEAEAEDRPAVNFYRSTGADSELHATHFTYSFDNSQKDIDE